MKENVDLVVYFLLMLLRFNEKVLYYYQVVKRLEHLNEIGISASSLGKLICASVDI